MRTVMCFGTFDLLHLGHLYYFKQAKKYGDYLIVVIARDVTKRKQKKEILFSEMERLELVENLSLVDEAVLGYPKDHYRIIEEERPDVICLGYDQPVEIQKLTQDLAVRGLFPTIVRIDPYKVKKQKSSYLREKVLKL